MNHDMGVKNGHLNLLPRSCNEHAKSNYVNVNLSTQKIVVS